MTNKTFMKDKNCMHIFSYFLDMTFAKGMQGKMRTGLRQTAVHDQRNEKFDQFCMLWIHSNKK